MKAEAGSAAGYCFHCGEPLPFDPPQALLDGEPRRFCCRGCAAAAEWIRSAGLEDYYRLRSREGERVEAAPADYAAWDRDDIQREHSRETATGREITLLVDGMHCAACAWLIDRALQRVPGWRSRAPTPSRDAFGWPGIQPACACPRRLGGWLHWATAHIWHPAKRSSGPAWPNGAA